MYLDGMSYNCGYVNFGVVATHGKVELRGRKQWQSGVIETPTNPVGDTGGGYRGYRSRRGWGVQNSDFPESISEIQKGFLNG